MLFLFNSILLGTGLAMDAFSVSMVNGLKEPKMPLRKMNLIAGVYAFFQFAMPMTGWICVHTILTYFKKFETFIPWIALILLLYIGGKMLIEGIRKTEEDTADNSALTFSTLIIQGIATSIDALSVGFTIANYALLMAVICSLIIAAVTYIISITGIVIGKKVGTKLSSKAAVLGGVILIAIGIEIFIKGIFF
ncbi:MAG: manganese efflux pump MntP family protein [Treponema sp.]|nr:manganese efflux pump MntP family protein [Spirochaetia bacterium]MDY4209860.1 manganese efflux pump MntP family protein [Treponema sp.]